MKEKKIFRMWNIMKEDIHNSEDNIPNYFHERDIWWCRLGVNIGFEQDGKGKHSSRPVLIIKKFTRHVAWIIPLTTKKKDNSYYISCKGTNGKIYTVIISQLRLISTKRLTDKIGAIDCIDFAHIKKTIKDLL